MAFNSLISMVIENKINPIFNLTHRKFENRYLGLIKTQNILNILILSSLNFKINNIAGKKNSGL